MKVLYIIADPPSALISKGELTPRYYNPGNVFSHVHVLTVSPDATSFPNMAVGNATTATTPLYDGDFTWNTMKSVANFPMLGKKAVALALNLKPDLVRCGDRLSGYLGATIKRELGIPAIMSLHCERDQNRVSIPFHKPMRWLREWERLWSRYAMPRMDVVVCVYWDIIPYALKNNSKVVKVIYNVVSPDYDPYPSIPTESNRLVWVSWIDRYRDPRNAMEAAKKTGYDLEFICGGMQNEKVLKYVSESYALVNNCNVSGIPKGVMEAMWCGVPVITTNSRNTRELQGDHCLKVQDNVNSWIAAFNLMRHQDVRDGFAKRGRKFAEERFHPVKTEREWADLFLEVIGEHRT